MIKNIVAIQNKKKTPINGTESEDSGIDSATRSMNTVTANMRVTATPSLSPDPDGRMKVIMVSKVMSTMGRIKLNT